MYELYLTSIERQHELEMGKFQTLEDAIAAIPTAADKDFSCWAISNNEIEKDGFVFLSCVTKNGERVLILHKSDQGLGRFLNIDGDVKLFQDLCHALDVGSDEFDTLALIGNALCSLNRSNLTSVLKKVFTQSPAGRLKTWIFSTSI